MGLFILKDHLVSNAILTLKDREVLYGSSIIGRTRI